MSAGGPAGGRGGGSWPARGAGAARAARPPGGPARRRGRAGARARAGRDKLTLVIEPRMARLGSWIEQLVAESTGKHGVGIVPVDGETLGVPGVYGDDPVFVRTSRGADAAWQGCPDAAR